MESIPFANLVAVVPGDRREIASLLRLRSSVADVVPTSVPLQAAVAVVAAVLARGAGPASLRRAVFDAVMADRSAPDGGFVIVDRKRRVRVTSTVPERTQCQVMLDLGHIAERLRAGGLG